MTDVFRPPFFIPLSSKRTYCVGYLLLPEEDTAIIPYKVGDQMLMVDQDGDSIHFIVTYDETEVCGGTGYDVFILQETNSSTGNLTYQNEENQYAVPIATDPTLASIDSLLWIQPDSAFAQLQAFDESREVDSLDTFNRHY